ncbi:hypothetical protein V5O48_018692 [Marasmius crinis-equi]|uniref:Uncharacterized protein n=1 Tax=Marasmius crinis-equi TaxID=585013 RepID=A0ABR3EKL8_9AGAR
MPPRIQQYQSLVVEYSKNEQNYLRIFSNTITGVAVPESELLAILKGQVVNLNKVFSESFAVERDSEQTAELPNSITIKLARSSNWASKKMRTQSDWENAFSRFQEVFTANYHFLSQDITEYQRYVRGLFQSVSNSYQPNIIELDAYICTQIAQHKFSWPFSDTYRFGAYEGKYLSSNGASFSASQRDNQGGGE